MYIQNIHLNITRILIYGLSYCSLKRGTHSDNIASIHLCAVANSTALSV